MTNQPTSQPDNNPTQQPSRIKHIFVTVVVASVLLTTLFYVLNNPILMTNLVFAQGSNLIKNGNFEKGLQDWVPSGEVEVTNDVGNPAPALYLETPHSSVDQDILASIPVGIYQLSYDCVNRSNHNYWVSVQYTITFSNPIVMDPTGTTRDECHTTWKTFFFTFLLTGDDSYSLDLIHAGNGGQGSVSARVDNVTLTKIGDVDDIDTGILKNGDFVGPDGWEYSLDARVVMTEGFTVTQLGSIRLLELGEMITQTNINVEGTTPITYEFQFNARNAGSSHWSDLSYEITSSDPLFEPISGSTDDFNADWITYTADIVLWPQAMYTLTIQYLNWGDSDPIVYIDNISLKDPNAAPPVDPEDYPLLNQEVLSENGACPVSACQPARGNANGVDTVSGNYRTGVTGLNIPVVGNTLQFNPQYASGGVQYGRVSSLGGGGWTHPYETQLRFENTTLPDTVELQTPTGDLLPFFITYTNGLTDYQPYPGVTADLLFDDTLGEFVVLGFNQTEYHFNEAGQLVELLNPDGNHITLLYENGRLATAIQGTRFLSYTYNAQGYLQTVTDHTGRSVQLGYTDGNLTTFTNPLGETTHYTYSHTNGLLTQIEDPSGRIVETVLYDDQDRAYHLEDGSERVLTDIEYAVTATNGLTQNVVTENGITTLHSYDVRRTLVGITPTCIGVAGCGETTGTGYDFNFKTNQVEDANGNTTGLEWNDNDGSSNLETVTNALNQTTQMVYDSTNNLTQLEDALGRTTVYTYSSHPAIPTFLVQTRDALGHVTVYTPTLAGVAGDSINGLLKATRDANGTLTTYQYNSFGQVTQMVVAAGTPDAITTTYTYDEVGRLVLTTQTSTSENPVTRYVYDDGDRLIATIANYISLTAPDWQSECQIPTAASDFNICTRYGYDEAGRPISTTTALGQTNLTLYDVAGRVVTSVVNYDGTTPLSTLCSNFNNPDPEYNLCSLTGYDEFGRIVTSTNSLGHATVTEYNVLGQVSRTIVNWQDGVSNVGMPDEDLITSYEYDAVGNVILTTDTLGRKTRTFYDALNRVAGTIINWDGSLALENCYSGNLPVIRDNNVCTRYTYDEVGNVTITTDTLGRQTRTFYNELNQVVATISNWVSLSAPEVEDCFVSTNNTSQANICTVYGYDENGRQTTVTNAQNQTSLTVYDAANRPVVQVNHWDKTTPILPDGTGCADTAVNPTATQNLCTFTSYDSLGRRESTTDVMGVVTTFGYDGLGRVITTTTSLHNSSFVIRNSYDALGNRLSQTDAENHTTTFTYDSLNRLHTTTSPTGVVITQTYNAAGWLLSTDNGLGQTSYTYDDLGRRLSVTDPEGHTTHYTYDVLGNQTAMTDAEGVQTSYLYDGLNRLEGVIENDVPGNNPTHETDVLTQYVYDIVGNRLVITNALAFTSSLTLYNDLNRPIVITDALGNETHLSYYALGQRHTVVDANGETTMYSYDALGRVSQVQYLADDETVSYTYDARGNVLTMNDSLGQTSYEYDGFGRLITVTNPFDEQIVYGYDQVGNRTSLTYPDGKLVQYTYDADNRLVEVLDWEGGVTSYTYDEIGRLATTTLPNHVQTHYTYDDANRLIHLLHVNEETGELIAEYEYLLDSVGNRLQTIERFRLPTTTLPGGQATNAPLDAEAVLTSIQPPDPAKEMSLSRRTIITGNEGQSSSYSVFITPTVPLTAGIPLSDVIAFTDTLPFTETVPFDPAAIVEQAENSIQTPPGETPYVAQETHEITFEEGSITFLVITETSSISQTATPSLTHPLTFTVPPTLTVALAEIAVGNHTLFSGPDTNVPDFEANIARFDLGNGLTEEFVARNAGVEQRWWISENPDLSGDLTIEVEVVTPLTLTIGGDGFVFVAHTAGNQIPVLQYARAVAIDAAENSYWAHLSAEIVASDAQGNHTYRLQMTFPADWLATAEYPLLVDPLISPVLRLETASATTNHTNPAIAYNPDDQEYLVVWQDYRDDGTANLYGQLVAADGALLGENFGINKAVNDQADPQVAYGGGQYLVVWRHVTNPADPYAYDALGQLVAATGEAIGSVLTIAANTSQPEKPTDVIYNSQDNLFLVLWMQRVSGVNWNVMGRYIAGNGAVDPTTLSISTLSNPEANARGTYDPTRNQFLVAWASWISGSPDSRDIKGRIISGGALGTSFTIVDESHFQDMPDVAYLPTSDRYLVVWHDARNASTNGYDIYARKVNPAGSTDGSEYALASGNASEQYPRLVVDTYGEVLVVWQKDQGGTPGLDVIARPLGGDGLALTAEFTLSGQSGNQSFPAIGGVGNGRSLVVWTDARQSSSDLYGQLLTGEGLYGGEFKLHPAAGDQTLPQVAYNPDDDEYLVVWQDYRSGTDWDIFGQRLSGDGQLLGENLSIYQDVGNYDQLAPLVVYGGGKYLVVWQHYPSSGSNYNVQGQFLTSAGAASGSAQSIASHSTYLEKPTDLAYNSTADKFLVVWQENSSGTWQIWGRHLLNNGGGMETAVSLTTATSQPQTNASVSYNPDNDKYLLVWEHQQTATDHDIHSQRLHSTLSPHGGVIPLAEGSTDQHSPDTTYHATNGRYFTVWQDHSANRTTLADIYLRWVSPSGLLGDEQLISNQTGDETHPRITLSLGNNLLILWQWGSGLYGLQADPDGQPFGRVFTLLDHPASQEQASIATTVGSSHLLTWQDNQLTNWNTYAALFQPWQETVITTTYDPLYRLTTANYHGSLNANYQYQYDAVGNITQLTETVDGQTTTTTRTFNPANQLLTADDGQLDTTFGYDNAGNLVQKDTPATYETLWYRYDQRHLLIAAGSMSLGEIYTTTLITYDGAGHRLQLTQGGTTTTYTLDYAGGMRVLYEQGGAFADTKHYLYGLACIAELVNADDPNTKKWRYYHQDGQPLVRQTTDEQGHITLAWGYSPSGATLYGEEGPVTNLDCGAIYDWGTGLIYKNGNYFDPNLQIWLSFAPLVVWQAWKAQQKKRHTGRKANNRRAILLLTLATLLLTAGCTSPGPLDPTATTLPTQTPTCTPTLPPPVIGQIPTNTPFPHPSTFTPFPTVTPSNTPFPTNTPWPTPTSVAGAAMYPSEIANLSQNFKNPFGNERFLVVNQFLSSFGEYREVGGGQTPSLSHYGIDLVTETYMAESFKLPTWQDNDGNTWRTPSSQGTKVNAPITGQITQNSGSTIKIESDIYTGLVIELTHVRTTGVLGDASLLDTEYGAYGTDLPHLHVSVLFNDVYYDPGPALTTGLAGFFYAPLGGYYDGDLPRQQH